MFQMSYSFRKERSPDGYDTCKSERARRLLEASRPFDCDSMSSPHQATEPEDSPNRPLR